MRINQALCASMAAIVLAAAPGNARAQGGDYYAGKRLTVVINYNPGGPADIEGRVFVKHLAKYIAGQPTVVVQNMDGAGGLIGVNYIGEIAPKDGTVLGLVTGAAWQYASNDKPRKVDFLSYEFVAYQPGTTVYFMRRDVKPGMRAPEDLGKAEGLISGGLGADNGKDLLLRLTLDMLGHKFKYVTGYRGSAAARLALEQGEINYYSESPPSYRAAIEPGIVKNGVAIGVFYDSGWDGKGFRTPRQVEGLNMLPYHELYQRIKGQPPSGQYWDVYRSIVALNHALQRMAIFPPGTPQAATDAIRAAVNKLRGDKDFAEEAVKTFGYVPDFVAEPGTNEHVRKALVVPASMKEFVAKYVADGAKLK